MHWLLDFLVTVIAACIVVLVAYVSAVWPIKYAAVVMLIAVALVIVAGIHYLDWRAREQDPPHVVISKIGALSDGQAFEKDEQAREAMKARLKLVPSKPRGPANVAPFRPKGAA